MAIGRTTSSLDELLQSLGQQIASSLLQRLGAAAPSAVGAAGSVGDLGSSAPTRLGPGRPRKAAAAAGASTPVPSCRVPGCVRKAEARRLCGSHYGKAQRLKMKLDALTEANLKLLALDGRALRWSSKGATPVSGRRAIGSKAAAAVKARSRKPAKRK